MEAIEDKKMEEMIKQWDVSLVDKHPELLHETFKNMFESPESQKLNEMAKSMDVSLVDKHPKQVHETFKNMFYTSDEEFNDAVKFHKDVDTFIALNTKGK